MPRDYKRYKKKGNKKGSLLHEVATTLILRLLAIKLRRADPLVLVFESLRARILRGGRLLRVIL